MGENAQILGVPIHPITKDEFKSLLDRYMGDQRQHFIATVNPEFIIEAQKNQFFKEILTQTDLNVADGVGIVWAAKYLRMPISDSLSRTRVGRARKRKRTALAQAAITLSAIPFFPRYLKTVIPERISGSTVVEMLLGLTTSGDCSAYLLGGKKGIATAAKIELEKKYPNALISGSRSGYLAKGESEERLINAVNKAKPDILIVALGSPKQECWIHDNLGDMPSVKIAVGVGGVLDYLSHAKNRAPQWMQKCGLEWSYRLLKEPSRLPRIKKATCEFIWEVVSHKVRNRE